MGSYTQFHESALAFQTKKCLPLIQSRIGNCQTKHEKLNSSISPFEKPLKTHG